MRYLVYLITLLFSTAVAQSPTILQGNYVSNVFGQANFVKNPNAQTNEANVTVSSASATRSTTTPLVATSEWNVTVTSANGTATWATRSFDEGMKNQNCEARFTYRGFQATSKAQIKQGANVVAELTLTPSATDPRIASINFPCGDLSAATTFVITDSATLSGVHEIGGIYVGLATNQANVAQAEFLGSIAWPTGAASETRIGSSWQAFQTLGTVNPTVTGNVTSPNRAPRVTIPSLKAGNYRITFSGSFAAYSPADIDIFCNFRITDGTSAFGSVSTVRSYGAISSVNGIWVPVIEFDFQYTGATTSKTFQLEAYGSTANTNCRVENYAQAGMQISVYRFPSSSELVVTPETQNVWGASTYAGTTYGPQYFSGTAAPTSYTTITGAGFTSRRTLKGKCKAPISGDDVGCQIENMPVGNYKLSFSGLTYEINSAIGYNVVCNYEMFETTLAQSIASRTSNTAKTASYSNDYRSTTMTGVFTNNSVANRNFVIRTRKGFDISPGSGSSCSLFVGPNGTNDHTTIDFVIEPLDNASNSALYVQGPVKAAATGAAIPDGYAGNVRSFRSLGCGTNVTYNAGASLTIQPGVWKVYGTATIWGGGTITDFLAFISPTPASSTWRQSYWNDSWFSSINVDKLPLVLTPFFIRYDGTTLYYFDNGSWGFPVSSATGALYLNFYRSSTSCAQVYSQIQAERIN